MIIGIIVTCAVGIIMIVLGYMIWKEEKISLLQDYHYDKVSEKNKKAFCAISGIGVIIVGIGLIITALVLSFTETLMSFIPFVIGFVIGLGLIVFAKSKYNSDK